MKWGASRSESCVCVCVCVIYGVLRCFSDHLSQIIWVRCSNKPTNCSDAQLKKLHSPTHRHKAHSPYKLVILGLPTLLSLVSWVGVEIARSSHKPPAISTWCQLMSATQRICAQRAILSNSAPSISTISSVCVVRCVLRLYGKRCEQASEIIAIIINLAITAAITISSDQIQRIVSTIISNDHPSHHLVPMSTQRATNEHPMTSQWRTHGKPMANQWASMSDGGANNCFDDRFHDSPAILTTLSSFA